MSAAVIGREGLLGLVEWAERLRAGELEGQGASGWCGCGHLPQMTAVTTVSEGELWRSFPEAVRSDIMGLLCMLLERLAVSPMPAPEGAGVSTMLLREHGDGKIQGWHRDRLAVVYVRQSSRQQVLDHGESTRRQYGLADGRSR